MYGTPTGILMYSHLKASAFAFVCLCVYMCNPRGFSLVIVAVADAAVRFVLENEGRATI